MTDDLFPDDLFGDDVDEGPDEDNPDDGMEEFLGFLAGDFAAHADFFGIFGF